MSTKIILIKQGYKNYIFNKKIDMIFHGEIFGFNFFTIKNSIVYVQNNSLKISKKERYYNSYFILIDEFYCHLDNLHNLPLEKLNAIQLKEFVNWKKRSFYNFEEENLKLLDQLKEFKERSLKLDKEREEYWRKIEEENVEKLEKAKQDFLSGKFIDVEHFEALLKEKGIKPNIRTLGSMRKRIKYISLTHYQQKIKGSTLYSIFDLAKELKGKLQA
jgi:hypothetical protein